MAMMAFEREETTKMSFSWPRGRRRERARTHFSSCFPDQRVWVLEQSDEDLGEEAKSQGRTLGSNLSDDEDGLRDRRRQAGREGRES